MPGRTHGMHAEPTTFGAKLALWCLQADRDRARLRAARDGIAVGKLSGAVGTYSNIDPRVEAHVCGALGLTAVPATQVIARDRHAELLWACASVGATIEMIGTEIRHLARTEVGEVEEAFGAGQKGSSAMPHKRNPILSERLSGLARVLRGYLGAGLEDVALWHERDISHSSVERVILPDACLLTYYVMRKAAGLVQNLVVHTERMRTNVLEGSFGLVFSQPVLLALVESGMERDTAYRIVQRDARAAWEERRPFRDVLEADADVRMDGGCARPCLQPGPGPPTCLEVPTSDRGGRGVSLTLVHSGKVRELYDAGEGRLLMVASDRLSAFDVILAEPIPDKGRVLTAMTVHFLHELADLAPSHLITADPDQLPKDAAELGGDAGLDGIAGRAVLVHRAEMLPIECIVRGYLAGSGWKEYSTSRTLHGTPLPAGLEQASRLPEPMFTPSTKATEGHDLNIGFDEAADLVGKEMAEKARDLCVEAYRRGAAVAERNGIIVADTKFELGIIDGELALCDEVLTPDSSRFWPADEWKPGTNPPAFDKQPVRDLLEGSGWDKKPPPPPLPPEVVTETSERYIAAYERISGRRLADWYGATR